MLDTKSANHPNSLVQDVNQGATNLCDEFTRSPDQRWNLARMKVPNIEGGQKVRLIGDSRGENRNIFGVCLAGHALDHSEEGGGTMVSAAFRIN